MLSWLADCWIDFKSCRRYCNWDCSNTIEKQILDQYQLEFGNEKTKGKEEEEEEAVGII